MNQTKNLAVKMILTLTIITVISGLILSAVWSVSEEKIKKNQVKKIEQALFELNPLAKNFKIITKGGQKIYKCFNEKGKFISYFFIAEGNGFQSTLKIAVSVDPQFRGINGIKVLEQMETPGLGAKIVHASFTDRFAGLSLIKAIVCKKEDVYKENSEVQAITGATISSKAVVKIINDIIVKLAKAGS